MREMSNWLSGKAFKVKDEYYTPRILVEAIVPFLKPGITIWCPFDTANSEFVLVFQEYGFNVIYSHLDLGQNFFEYEPEQYDCIVSNPPFTLKLKILERLYQLKKPFAMLMGLPILNYQEIDDFFMDKELQLLIVNKKVSFDGHGASFNNSYFCHQMLPRDLMFTKLPHNNAGRHYVPSRMHQDKQE